MTKVINMKKIMILVAALFLTANSAVAQTAQIGRAHV
jgi:ABC-type transporter Mla maintaining outer membrane lipid asymmetry permease subunit MlaE